MRKDKVVKKEILLAVISREVFEQLYNHLGKPVTDARYDEIDKALRKSFSKKTDVGRNERSSKWRPCKRWNNRQLLQPSQGIGKELRLN